MLFNISVLRDFFASAQDDVKAWRDTAGKEDFIKNKAGLNNKTLNRIKNKETQSCSKDNEAKLH